MSGSIVGNVFDQAGMPMPGVKVVANSATQIGGQKATYSGADGSFRFSALFPGTFEVVASAPKMNAIHQKGIKVGVNAPAEVNIIMEVAAAQETVKVVEKAPIVSTKSANVKEVWDEEFVDNLPLATRTSVEELLTAAPGGSGDPGARVARIRGGNQNQNMYLVDGFNLTGLKTVYKSLAALEISTAGYGADGAIAPGGLVSMVTKSGSNRFEIDVNGFHEDSRLRFNQSEADLVPNDLRSYINPNFSGPIIKDKLWFYVNGEARNEIYSSFPDPAGIAPTLPDQHYWNYRGTLKLAYQINPRNKINSFTFIDKNWSRNRNRSYFSERDAQQKRERYGFFSGLTWESLLLDNLFFTVQGGISQTQENLAPQKCLEDNGVDCLHEASRVQTIPGPNRILGNNSTLSFADMKAIELIGTLEWFLDSKSWGSHSVKLQSRYYTRDESSSLATPGDRIYEMAGEKYSAVTEYFANDPRLEAPRYGWTILTSSGSRLTTTLQDVARVTRYVTVTPGVGMTTSSSSNNRSANSVTDGVAFTPHLSIAWDATHDGRTVLRTSFNQYVDPDVGRLSKHTLGGRVSKRCSAGSPGDDPQNILDGVGSACEYSGGASSATVGSPCGPSGIDANGNKCLTGLKTPRTTEFTVGAERELTEGLGVGIDFVYRKYANQYSTKETNRIWNPGGTLLDRNGGYRNGKATQVIDLETPEEAERLYNGVTLAAHKREGNLKVSASYTWSRQYGNIWDTEVNAWGDIPPRDLYLWGPTPDDSTHNIKTTLVYNFTRWFSTGALYSYSSGAPYNRYFRNAQTGGFDDLRARVGTDPGRDLNDPADDRDIRLPDIQSLAIQLRANMKPLTGQDLELYADILNVLGLRTATSYVQEDGPQFGLANGQMSPSAVRLGFRFRY